MWKIIDQEESGWRIQWVVGVYLQKRMGIFFYKSKICLEKWIKENLIYQKKVGNTMEVGIIPFTNLWCPKFHLTSRQILGPAEANLCSKVSPTDWLTNQTTISGKVLEMLQNRFGQQIFGKIIFHLELESVKHSVILVRKNIWDDDMELESVFEEGLW